MNTNPHDEAAGSAAVSSFIAKHFSKMAASLGGATILESAVSEMEFLTTTFLTTTTRQLLVVTVTTMMKISTEMQVAK